MDALGGVLKLVDALLVLGKGRVGGGGVLVGAVHDRAVDAGEIRLVGAQPLAGVPVALLQRRRHRQCLTFIKHAFQPGDGVAPFAEIAVQGLEIRQIDKDVLFITAQLQCQTPHHAGIGRQGAVGLQRLAGGVRDPGDREQAGARGGQQKQQNNSEGAAETGADLELTKHEGRPGMAVTRFGGCRPGGENL